MLLSRLVRKFRTRSARLARQGRRAVRLAETAARPVSTLTRSLPTAAALVAAQLVALEARPGLARQQRILEALGEQSLLDHREGQAVVPVALRGTVVPAGRKVVLCKGQQGAVAQGAVAQEQTALMVGMLHRQLAVRGVTMRRALVVALVVYQLVQMVSLERLVVVVVVLATPVVLVMAVLVDLAQIGQRLARAVGAVAQGAALVPPPPLAQVATMAAAVAVASR